MVLFSGTKFINSISCYYQVSQAMSNNYLKVSLTQTLKDALKCMHDGQRNCVLVVDGEDYLEGILTYGDIGRYRHKKMGYSSTGDTPNPDVRDNEVFIIFVFVYVFGCMMCRNKLICLLTSFSGAYLVIVNSFSGK